LTSHKFLSTCILVYIYNVVVEKRVALFRTTISADTVLHYWSLPSLAPVAPERIWKCWGTSPARKWVPGPARSAREQFFGRAPPMFWL